VKASSAGVIVSLRDELIAGGLAEFFRASNLDDVDFAVAGPGGIVYHGRKRTAISVYGERQFRTKSYTDFGRSRTVVSADAEHPFRLMPNSPGS